MARRYLAAGREEEAGVVLRGAAPAPGPGRPAQVDEAWETVWIDYLERAGDAAAAQAARWTAFKRTLAGDRLRAFVRHLPDFEDVEAEARGFA